MVRRRSTVRFRKGAPSLWPGKRRLTCANAVRRHLHVLRLATAETGRLRVAVPYACPRQSSSSLPSSLASSAVSVRPGSPSASSMQRLAIWSWPSALGAQRSCARPARRRGQAGRQRQDARVLQVSGSLKACAHAYSSGLWLEQIIHNPYVNAPQAIAASNGVGPFVAANVASSGLRLIANAYVR
jgi:hypothetical protein